MRIRITHLARTIVVAALFLCVTLLGLLTGVLFAFSDDLPAISALDDYAPNTITRVFARGGELVAEFATERRVVIGYQDIAPRLREAIIAGEDAGFTSHFGLSISRIIITVLTDVLERRMAGASTLTQQLARNLFPDTVGFERTLERKIKEAIVAIQIEKRYTKREILTFYCNHIHFGHGTYGVEAAARLYFGKSARDVTLEEAALIAGIIQTPARQSPFVDQARARQRRNYVLQQMAEEGYISKDEAEIAKQRPIVLRDAPRYDESPAPYFVEEVRKHLERKYGSKRLYGGGLTVQTSLDMTLQRAANQALDLGLRRIDKRRGFRRPIRNVVREGHDPAAFGQDRWKHPLAVKDIVPAVITTIDSRGIVHARVGRYQTELTRQAVAWTGQTTPANLVAPGDLIEVRIDEIDEAAARLVVTLEQEPNLEGAIVAIDHRTGQIRAMVGGYSFSKSKFNRSTQAYRQLGSAFKPLLYTAAIDRGYTSVTMLDDSPVSFPAGPNQPPYAPQNYDHKFEGPITLRRALEKSRNVPAVRVMAQLGPQHVIGFARRFGLDSPLQPYLSTALGASETTLLQISSAYSAYPNQGVRMTPFAVRRVTDRAGSVLEENRSDPHDVIRADTAFVMTSLLRGVVQRGTAAAAASIPWPLGGKTGTVDDFTDAWFVGFDPDLTVGVWVGRDEKKPIGYGEDGARTALPIWMDVMRAHISNRKEAPQFAPPGNIVFLAVSRMTGELVAPDAQDAITETFISRTEPGTPFFR